MIDKIDADLNFDSSNQMQLNKFLNRCEVASLDLTVLSILVSDIVASREKSVPMNN